MGEVSERWIVHSCRLLGSRLVRHIYRKGHLRRRFAIVLQLIQLLFADSVADPVPSVECKLQLDRRLRWL